MNRKIGKYDIIERLGRGGMAEVFRAYHASLDRYVAIKVLHAFLADDPEFKGRFEREAQNVAKLKHPNIVQVYDFDFDPPSESYYMVMELVEGPTLKDRLQSLSDQGNQMTLAESLRIIREAAGALAYAHSRSMIHRDVKPANLMLDHDNRVVLTDFGIAKIVTGAQFTASGGMVGTPAYMAPEQGLGEAGDERSDLYSLGIILFQLVTGKLPYDAETPLAIILKHLNTPTPLARAFKPDLPDSVDRIIAKAISKESDDRYQSAADFILDLERAERGEPVEAGAKDDRPALLQSPDQETVRIPRDDTPTQEIAAPQQVRRSGLPWWGWGGLVIVLVALVIVGAASGVFSTFGGGTPTPTPTTTAETTSEVVVGAPSDTVAAAVPSDTPVRVPTDHSPTATNTPTVRPTQSPAPSNTPTRAPTRTATPTPSRTPAPSETPSRTPTWTPSPNITATAAALAAIQSATATACRFDYAILEQDPPDNEIYPANRPYERKILLQNTGICDWEPNTFLNYVEGESYNAGPRIFIQERVPVGEQVELNFVGKTPVRGADYTGIWELRTPNQRKIGEPIEIRIRVYEGG
ncbi:MAG: protein kinase [Chloroflexi bacterium]|nr:protein kinase [Chloroflexota bacterium]